MDEVRRRAFCALMAASVGSLAGCNYMDQNQATVTPKPARNGTVVTTTKELESAFANLATGDTVYISEENAPYRTTKWLDIDVDGVTVNGPEIPTLIKPADGANVGGFRVGHNSRCREIDIRGVGYDGNPKGQGRQATRLHGISVENAQNVTLEGNQIRRTSPRTHGDGGSGISVTRQGTGVRIINNRIHEYGDRGVQLGGRRVIVSGNMITRGPDRPIACDLWPSKQRNLAAQSVAIFGNLLGNSFEGSCIGVARNNVQRQNKEYVSIFGNVGFGSHKNFCHIRGSKRLQNISVQNNVSIQKTEQLTTDTKKFAGVAVNVAKASNISIMNNEFYNYRGHGIHVFETSISDLSIQHNSLVRPGLAGIRVNNATDGMINGNLITRPGEAGIRLDTTSNMAVRSNYIKRAGTAAIWTEGSTSRAGNDISANHITGNNRKEGRTVPAILVRTAGNQVTDNTIHQNGAPAIVEAGGASNNLYDGNWADGQQPWHISNPSSRIRNHTPAVGVHRGVTTGPENDSATVRFSRPFSRPPRLSFGRGTGEIAGSTYQTDDNDNFVGVTVRTRGNGTTFDLFVDDA